MIKYFITDFDGTLVDTRSANIKAYSEAFRVHGYEFNEYIYKNAFGLKFDDMCDVLNVPTKYRQQIKQTKADVYPQYFELIKVNTPLLHFLTSNIDGKLAIASTASSTNLHNVLNHFDIANKFDVIVTGDDVIHGKPNPEVYNVVKQKLGITDNSEVLVFEDSDVGIQSAQVAGLYNIIKVNEYK